MGVLNGAFTANGQQSEGVEGINGELIVGGVFVMTIQLQVAIPDAAGADSWVKVAELTAPGVVQYNSAAGRKFRAASTAFTSGTARYSVAAARSHNIMG